MGVTEVCRIESKGKLGQLTKSNKVPAAAVRTKQATAAAQGRGIVGVRLLRKLLRQLLS